MALNPAWKPLRAALTARAKEAPVLMGEQSLWRAGDALAAVEELAARLNGCHALAVLADNGPAWALAELAALAADVPHVPLPTFFQGSQLAHVLDTTGADCLLTDQPERIGALDRGFAITGRDLGLIRMQRVPLEACAALPSGTAKVSFTSGSTGAPRGVCLAAQGLADTAAAVASRLADLDLKRHLAVLPLSLLLENVAGLHAALLSGAEVHLPGLAALGWRGMAGFDPLALEGRIAQSQPASLILVPELLKAWTLHHARTGGQAPESLRFVAVGGARVDGSILAQARRQGIPAYQGYGLTECGSVVSLNRPGDDGDDCGRPLDHARVSVVDGEVIVATRAFLGYLGSEPASADPAGFRPHATGDLGGLGGTGHLALAGRRGNLLVTSWGRNVSPEWIEAALLAQSAVQQAVVGGDARPWLWAVLVPAPGAKADDLAAAVAAANAGLPDYARVGGWVSSVPLTFANGMATGNGRPRRGAVQETHAAALAALYESIPETPRKETADVLL